MEISELIGAFAFGILGLGVMLVYSISPKRLSTWRKSRVRSLGKGDTYVRLTPNFGLGLRFGSTRIRYARHHGLQLMKKSRGMWHVEKQLAGKSKVKA